MHTGPSHMWVRVCMHLVLDGLEQIVQHFQRDVLSFSCSLRLAHCCCHFLRLFSDTLVSLQPASYYYTSFIFFSLPFFENENALITSHTVACIQTLTVSKPLYSKSMVVVHMVSVRLLWFGCCVFFSPSSLFYFTK